MLYYIDNESIKVTFSEKGGEMQSIINKSNGLEYLWQGNPEFWAGRAYNLFPICGRLTEGKYTYRGKEYEMNLHGFLRNTVMTVTKKEKDSITFTISSDETSLAQYPFEFIFNLTYTIDGGKISTVFEVKNIGENVMYYAVGGHPGFNVPLCEGEKFDDYYLEFACVKPMERIITTPLFNTGKIEAYPMTDGKIIELSHSLFDNDARFFTNMCKKVTLKSKKSDVFVRLEYPNMTNLGIWHKPETEAPYVCIEPWSSLPSYDGKIDDIETKYEMTALEPNETKVSGFDIIIG